ncbi:carbohydrate binding domain-containing protein [bacterium]|nr:carbohydrate binding domain-containing protein [bacterium]
MSKFPIICCLLLTSFLFSQGNQEIISSKRACICLNGQWRFMPAKSVNSVTQSEWGSIWVPGSWNGSWRLPGIIEKGNGPSWSDVDLLTLGRAWYEKTVQIPAEWEGRAILLRLERVSTDAIVYANGIECGKVEWPFGQVDITKAVKAGEDATIRILVASSKDEDEAKALLDLSNPNYSTNSQLDTRGIIGEVFLESRPKGGYIKDVFIQTSVRKKSLILDVELSDIEKGGKADVIARVLSEDGREEKRFTSQINLDGSPQQKFQLTWRWDNPKLWDYRQPYLYKLLLQIKGEGIDDEWGGTFGFREFWIEGKRFFLNGTEIRLRPICAGDEWNSCAGVLEVIEAMLEGYLETGFNIVELWPWNHDERGRTHFRELWCEIADRKGILMMAPALDMSPYITWSDLNHWWQPGVKERYEKRMSDELKRFRNHPSVVIWTTTPNFAGYDWQDQNPRYIGRKNWYEGKNPSTDKHWGAIREGISLIKKYDPTRPVLVHHGVYNGDIFAPNTYLNLIPLQEREEWLSHWVKYGDMPYLPIEFGTPFHCTFMRGRDGFSNAIISEPLMTEFSAIYLGKKAYELETNEYRSKIIERYQGDQLYSNWQGAPELVGAPAFQAVEKLFIRNTWRSWRTFGITGGMVPWADGIFWDGKPGEINLPPFEEGRRGMFREKVPISYIYYLRPEGNVIRPALETIREVDGPTLAWIAGPKEAFTAKDHNFFVGEKVEKQVILINDERKTVPYSFSWEAFLNDKIIGKGSGKGEIKPASNLSFPIKFKLPPRIDGDKVDGKIVLKAKIGDYEHKDEFEFRVFRPLEPKREKLYIFDPVGETAKLLKELGYEVQLVQEKIPKETSTIIIGRKVLSKGFKLPFDLEAFVREGGKALIMSQDPEWMRNNFGFRVARHLSRRVFIVDANHPIVQGLDDEDLRDWRGSSNLVDDYPEYKMEEIPAYGWHWGNRGAVTSAAIEKPHRGGWRPILECEFDLAYSPLMELNYGKGLLILSTLDLEDHSSLDPASNRLSHQLIQYLLKGGSSSPKVERAIYIGGEKGEKLLNFLGVNFGKADGIKGNEELLIIGEESNLGETALRKYIESGGKVLFLPREKPVAPLGVKLENKGRFHGSLNVPKWGECAGLSPSDLRWRTDYSAWLITDGCEIGADGLLGKLRIGKGVAIYCQIDPMHFNTKERVINGNFEQELNRWTLGIYGNAKAEMTIDSDIPQGLKREQPTAKAVKITVSQKSDQPWHVQFRQPVGMIEKGRNYILSFWAKADKDCKANVALIMDHEPFNIVDFVKALDLTTQWRHFQFTIEASTNDKVRIEFQLANETASYWLTGISFRPLGEDNSEDIVATYFRFTRWRTTRAISQILANLGASFKSDSLIFQPMPREISLAGKWKVKMTVKLPPATSADQIHPDPGMSEEAKILVGKNPPEEGWESVNVPGLWQEFQNWDGEAVFSLVVDIPPQWAGRDLLLSLGAIDDYDSTFFNGELVGKTDNTTPNWWSVPRQYVVPGRLVKAGKNTIAVRVFDNYGGGGFAGKTQELFLKPKDYPFPVDFYHPDYRSDFPLGDDPYRYYRW